MLSKQSTGKTLEPLKLIDYKKKMSINHNGSTTHPADPFLTINLIKRMFFYLTFIGCPIVNISFLCILSLQG